MNCQRAPTRDGDSTGEGRRRQQQEGPIPVNVGCRSCRCPADQTLPVLGVHAAVAVTFTVKECSSARFRFRSFTMFPTIGSVPREVPTPLIVRRRGPKVGQAHLLQPPVRERGGELLARPAVVVDGETVIVNGFGITTVALAAGAMSPIIRVHGQRDGDLRMGVVRTCSSHRVASCPRSGRRRRVVSTGGWT